MPPSYGKIQQYVLDIFDVMVRDSRVDPGVLATDTDQIIWEGSLNKIFLEKGINQGYHTPIMRLLTQLECIEQLQRGSRTIKSKYRLGRDPRTIPADEWPSVQAIVKSGRQGLTARDSGYIMLEARLKEVERKVGQLNIARALAELSAELAELRELVTVTRKEE